MSLSLSHVETWKEEDIPLKEMVNLIEKIKSRLIKIAFQNLKISILFYFHLNFSNEKQIIF